ncbi:polysaccharide biosynthesis protein [Thalassotalea insulae]|uniref:Polysaccharide biosynthesis protein n=1 Tax=Thalassotalea insulae TaxID=2056778 RepID=A0ABQ6GSC2_9GAMM|nr:oligosaccharide flippase family protein [Thalassotalea insulae]GLX77581.1 polysaccharide biosynthesis protein [Thalassotalea insulae]
MPFLCNIKESAIVRSILVLVGGTAGAQAVTFLLSPIITRLYTPEALGIFGSFIAIVAVLLPIAAFSLPIAIVLPEKNEEARKIAKLATFISVFFSIALAIFFIIFKSQLAVFFKTNEDSSLLLILLISLAVLLGTILAICSQWLIRNKLFMISAKTMMLHSIISNTLKVIIGLLSPTGKALIILNVFGTLLHSILLIAFVKKNKKNGAAAIPIGAYFDVKLLKKYKAFVVYRGPQGVLANINQNIPIILLASFYSPAVTGIYVLCRTVLILPITLIAKSVNDVIYPQINKAYLQYKPIVPLLKSTTMGLAVLALPPLLLFIITGPQLFAFVFGENWQQSGEFSQWLTIWFYFNFINRACVAAIPVLKLEAFLLGNSILNFLLSILGFFLGNFLFSEEIYAIALYSLLGIIPQVFLIIYVFISALKHDRLLGE